MSFITTLLIICKVFYILFIFFLLSTLCFLVCCIWEWFRNFFSSKSHVKTDKGLSLEKWVCIILYLTYLFCGMYKQNIRNVLHFCNNTFDLNLTWFVMKCLWCPIFPIRLIRVFYCNIDKAHYFLRLLSHDRNKVGWIPSILQ